MFLGYPNRAHGATITGGSWNASYPVTNLATRALDVVARSTNDDATSTKFIIDMGATYTVQAFALRSHNLSSAATIKLDFGTSSGGTEGGTSGTVNAWQMSFDSVMRNFPSGTYDSIIGYPFDAIYVHSAAMAVRYVECEITDTSNPLNYVQAGRVCVFGGLVPAYNFEVGASIDWVDLTEPERTLGGSIVYQQRRRYRVAEIPLTNFSATERGKLMAARLGAGVHDELLFVPDSTDMANAQEYGFVARFVGGQKMPWSMPTRYSTTLVLEEIL